MSASATIHVNKQKNIESRPTNKILRIGNGTNLDIIQKDDADCSDDDDDLNSIDGNINRSSPLFFCPRTIGDVLRPSRSNSPDLFSTSKNRPYPPAADALHQVNKNESSFTPKNSSLYRKSSTPQTSYTPRNNQHSIYSTPEHFHHNNNAEQSPNSLARLSRFISSPGPNTYNHQAIYNTTRYRRNDPSDWMYKSLGSAWTKVIVNIYQCNEDYELLFALDTCRQLLDDQLQRIEGEEKRLKQLDNIRTSLDLINTYADDVQQASKRFPSSDSYGTKTDEERKDDDMTHDEDLYDIPKYNYPKIQHNSISMPLTTFKQLEPSQQKTFEDPVNNNDHLNPFLDVGSPSFSPTFQKNYSYTPNRQASNKETMYISNLSKYQKFKLDYLRFTKKDLESALNEKKRKKPQIFTHTVHDSITSLLNDYFNENYINRLPNELLIEIFQFLPANKLSDVAQVCKEWSGHQRGDPIWRPLYIERFHFLEAKQISSSFYELFEDRLRDPHIGDLVEVAWKGKFRLESLDIYQGLAWWSAIVVDKAIQEHKYKIHYPGWDSRWDEWVHRDRLRWTCQVDLDQKICVNDDVEVWCCGSNVPGAWLEAVVTKIRNNKYCVGKVLQQGAPPLWVDRDRIRISPKDARKLGGKRDGTKSFFTVPDGSVASSSCQIM